MSIGAEDAMAAVCGGCPVEAVVEALGRLSRGGPVLELGVGTGRIALPLAAAGVQVTGIDSSTELLEELRAKPGGAELPVLLGNFRDVEGGPYDLVYAVCDAFCQLLEQEDQVACFANISQALTDGGTFLVETSPVPTGTLSVQEVSDERIVVRVCAYDSVHQMVSTATLVFSETGVRTFRGRMRHTPPAELDLMARIAGLTLVDRWGDWTGGPPTSASDRVVSVYRLETDAW